MAHRGTHPINTPKTEAHLLECEATGAGTADLAIVGDEIVSATRSATGTFALVFRHKYPQGLVPFSPGVVGTTTGLTAIFTAWNPAAGTATVQFSVGSVATDPAATDSIRFAFLVRNSGRNPS